MGENAPGKDPYRPAGHGEVQLAIARPGLDPYNPAGQLEHIPTPPAEYFPTGHIDAVELVDPATHAYPALHSPLQLAVAMAATLPYRPATQSTHTLALAREYFPAAHASDVEFVDPGAHTYPALQLPLQLDDDRPDKAPKSPAGQAAVHDAEGMLALAPYSPAEQLVHTDAPARE